LAELDPLGINQADLDATIAPELQLASYRLGKENQIDVENENALKNKHRGKLRKQKEKGRFNWSLGTLSFNVIALKLSELELKLNYEPCVNFNSELFVVAEMCMRFFYLIR